MKTTYYKGYWNGKEIAKFCVVLAIVGDTPPELAEHFQINDPGKKHYAWYKAFLGHSVQMVEVTIGNEVFYLSNIDGSGLYKVTAGRGLPICGHFSVYPSKIIKELPEDKWTDWNPQAAANVKEQVDAYWTKADPIGYAAHKQKMKHMLSLMNRRN